MTFIKMPDYSIYIEDKGLENLVEYIEEIYDYKDVFVVTDQTVYKLYHQRLLDALPGFRISFVIVEDGEKSKSIEVYQHTIEKLIEQGMKRNHLLISLGGGVVGDLAGFVAATLYRGVSYIQIPTTLLAQVDSSIGGKVAIDLKEGKNLIGAFYNPKFVLIDVNFLKTLDQREYANGLAEMIKAGLIGDKKLYHYLLEHETVGRNEIAMAIQVKRDVVLADPYDHKERMYLNFGHTFGHAIEKKHGYELYKHGEAISYGMLIALEVGVHLNETKPELYDEVKALLIRRGLVKEPLLLLNDYIDEIKTDKKNLADGLHFILVPKVGEVKIKKMKLSDLS